MSCFGGRMNEYRFLSIDRFDGDNLMSKMFFLSHAHEDHMTGLDSPRFSTHLAVNNYRLYVQKVTALLLVHDPKYRHLEKYLEPLEVDEPFMLNVPKSVTGEKEADTITVTLLSAGHCPGSVMFLFEGAEGNVLYTGDIRLNGEDLMTMEALRSGEQVKAIRSIYFDSTFCTLDTIRIVDRKESVRAVIDLAKQHLNEDKKNRVLLFCTQKYGHEFLMCQLSKELGTKCHVTGSKYDLYTKIAGIAPYVTSDGSATRIHACAFWIKEDEELSLVGTNSKDRGGNSSRYKQVKRSVYAIPSCPDCRPWDKNVIVIKPSMLWFRQSRSVRETLFYDEQAGHYRLQYSCHSSLAEVRELLDYLRPANVYPNVIPSRYKDYTAVYTAIRDFLPSNVQVSPQKTRQILRSTTSRCTSTWLQSTSERKDCNRDAMKSEFLPRFVGRKRYIESVLAEQKRKEKEKKRKLNEIKRKERPPPASWEACLHLSDSDSDSSAEEKEEDPIQDSDSSPDESESESSSSSLMGVVEDSDKEEEAPRQGSQHCAVVSETSVTAKGLVRQETSSSSVVIIESPELAKASAADIVADQPVTTAIENIDLTKDDSSINTTDDEYPLRLHLSDSSDQEEKYDKALDSDVDLFDPSPPPSPRREKRKAAEEKMELPVGQTIVSMMVKERTDLPACQEVVSAVAEQIKDYPFGQKVEENTDNTVGQAAASEVVKAKMDPNEIEEKTDQPSAREIEEKPDSPPPCVSKASSVESLSLEIIGEFRRNENPPLITICSQEMDYSPPTGQEAKKDDAVSKCQEKRSPVANDQSEPSTSGVSDRKNRTKSASWKKDGKTPTKSPAAEKGLKNLAKSSASDNNGKKTTKTPDSAGTKKSAPRKSRTLNIVKPPSWMEEKDDEEDLAWLRAAAYGLPDPTVVKKPVPTSPVKPPRQSRVRPIYTLF